MNFLFVCYRFASGGWDTNLKIWSASFDQDTDEPAHKKAKGMLTRVPLHTLKGHKETISSTVWIDPYSICTASMDHTIKFWDAEVRIYYLEQIFNHLLLLFIVVWN